MKLIKSIDILGQPIDLNFDSNNIKKTFFGGILTICVIIFTIYCVFYFGFDIIEKKKPITKFTKQFVNESATYLNDFPFTFYVTNIMTDRIIDVDKYLTFFVRYYENKVDEAGSYSAEQHQLFVERCNLKHFDKFHHEYKENLPLGDELYCLNPNKIKYNNGTIHQNRTDLNFKNEMTASPSNIVRFEIYECDPIRDNKECHPVEKRRKLLKEFYIILYLLDYYIDTSDYDQPNKPYVYSLPQPLSLGSTKETLFKIKTAKIVTDSGYLMEDIGEKQINQLENYFKDTQISRNGESNEEKLYALGFGNTRIQDINERKYLKIQDLIALVGGLIKSMLLLGSLVCHHYSYYSFISTLSNLIFVKFEEKESNVKIHRINILKDNHQSEVNLKMKFKKLQLTNIQNNNATNIALTSTPLRTSFNDLILAKCKKTSKYDQKVYTNITHFISSQFNVLYIIKQFIKIDTLVEIFNKNSKFKECLEQKINYDSYKFELISNNLGDSIELKQRLNEYQEKLNIFTQ